MRRVLSLFFILLSFQLMGQNPYQWWEDLHNYPQAAGPNRNRYITISPGFMGPNALRVPELFNGRVNNEYYLQLGGDFHRGTGDKTDNLFVELNFALAKDRVSLYANYIPKEWYEITPETRDERRSTDFDGKGSVTGDIQIGTLISLWREEKSGFNATFRIQLKTTSGNKLEFARFTDHSMFNFDAQFSKTLIDRGNAHLLIKAMLGFLTYQTNQNGLPNGSQYLQNDAPLYGLGLEYGWKRLLISSDVSGYHGYLENRDTPTFWRNQLSYRVKDFEFRSEYNLGLKTWDWNTFKIATRWYFAEAK